MMNTDYSKMYKEFYGDSYQSKHHNIFPKNIFMIIAGSTGCGKTNLMMNFLMNKVVHYDDIMVYTTTPQQDAYRFLRDCNIEIKKKTSKDIITFHNPEEGIVNPSTLDKNKTHIVIFDDVMNENQKDIIDYFCQGRHNNVNVFYLCQSIHHLKKHGIRQNANIFILFRQDKKTLKFFYDTHVSGDMPFKDFEQICEEAWKTNHGYIVINLWEEPKYGRYILNYDTMYIPNNT